MLSVTFTITSDVNKARTKDLTFKAGTKDLTLKAKDLTFKAGTKDLTFKARSKHLTHKAKARTKYLTFKARTKDLTHQAKDLSILFLTGPRTQASRPSPEVWLYEVDVHKGERGWQMWTWDGGEKMPEFCARFLWTAPNDADVSNCSC